MDHDIPAIGVGILAGGKSTRMGENKTLLKINGERMTDRLIRQFEDFPELTVSCAKNNSKDFTNVRTVTDENDGIGPIEGIRRILSQSQYDHVFICAGDMPYVTAKLAKYLAQFISSDNDAIVIADEDHIHPLCAIYKKSVLPVIDEVINENNYRIREVLKRVRTLYIDISLSCFDKKVLKNVNTKEEYFECIRPVVVCVAGYSGSGKTYLIEKLINEFKKEGCSTGVIKHDGHDRIKDAEGTDTDKFYSAGADLTAVIAGSGYMIRGRGNICVKDVLKSFDGYGYLPDVILLEGFKHSQYPKLWLTGRQEAADIPPDESDCILIVSEQTVPDASVPVYHPDDVRGIFLYLKEYFGMEI